jgi:hypothetical protein
VHCGSGDERPAREAKKAPAAPGFLRCEPLGAVAVLQLIHRNKSDAIFLNLTKLSSSMNMGSRHLRHTSPTKGPCLPDPQPFLPVRLGFPFSPPRGWYWRHGRAGAPTKRLTAATRFGPTLSRATRLRRGSGNAGAWNPIETAPLDKDVTLEVTDGRGAPYRLPNPCRRTASGWVSSSKGTPLAVTPVRWKPLP